MYTEIVFQCERSLAETFSDALLDCGALSTSIEDASAGTEDEEPLYGEPGMQTDGAAWIHNHVIALFDARSDVQAIIREAERHSGLQSPLAQTRRDVAEQDWVRLTQSQFEPIEISARVFIVPSWHVAPAHAKADAVLIELDPGLAFGTGSHATTRLCLEWLEQAGLDGQDVIDYGCGSGILAIAAKRLGAKHVIATDIDPLALTATCSNADNNQVEIEVLDAASLPPISAGVVVANILSNPLKLLAPALAGCVAPDGWLVISGVLERQIDEVCEAYREILPLTTWRTSDGWACLVGHKTR